MAQGIARHNFREPAPYLVTAAVVGSATTWSITNESVHVLLSNGNLTATGDGFGANFGGQANTSISAASRIFFVANVDSVAAGNLGVGFGNASQNFDSYLGADTNSVGAYSNGPVYFNNIQIATIPGFTTGAFLGFAVDTNSGLFWVTLDGTTWNNDILANQNPAVGSQVGGTAISVSGSVFPAFSFVGSSALTAGFSSSSWAPYTAPTGYSQSP